MASDYSKRLRSRGNQVFKEACSECLAPVVRKGRFLNAGSFYTQALYASKSEDERAKCSKNLGAVNWNHAKMVLELYEDGPATALNDSSPAFYVEKSVEHYLAALRHGRASHQRREWTEDIEKTLEDIVKCLLEEHARVAERGFLDKLCGVFQSGLQPGARSRAFEKLQLGYIQVVFDDAVKELKRRDQASSGANYSKCLALLHSCSTPIEEAQKRAKYDSEAMGRIETLKTSINACRATCESIQSREAGKRFRQESMKARDEASRQDLAIFALDKFKEAVVHARGFDAECEAEALACIGDLYTEVLRKEQQAQPYYTMVVKLAQNSDTMQSAKWYQRAKTSMNLWFKRRHEGPKTSYSVLPEIKGDVEKLENEFKRLNTDDFLRFLYKAHPPRGNNGSFSLSELDGGSQSRIAVRKALRHYHPDHNAVGDDRWTALCGEITKLLLQKHRGNVQE
ncbi:hypothetical protein Mapa_013751 [Marchantia paleacea]|nr:hypothetical protein Mapa_013751 [Marchantia paleacea]